MKKLFLITVSSLFTGPLLLAEPTVAPEMETELIEATQQNAHQMAIALINNEIEETRQTVWKLTEQNPSVKQQYNAFVNELRQVYLNGEGMIAKDIIRILHAIEFAAHAHQGQVRKNPDTTPYIIHPIRVANHLLTIGIVRDRDILIAALLHDTLEDTKTTFSDIRKSFGKRVAYFVSEVTDNKNLPREEQIELQILNAPRKSAAAAQIKLGDALDNLKSLSINPPLNWKDEKVEHYFEWKERLINRLPWVNAALKEANEAVIKQYFHQDVIITPEEEINIA